MKLAQGQQAPLFIAYDINGKKIALKNFANKKILLSFFRYAGCPFCTYTFEKLLEHHSLFSARGLSVITFFQSPRITVIKDIGKFNSPFPVIADPNKKVYSLYDVTSTILGWPNTLLQTPAVIDDMFEKHIMQKKIDGDINLIPAHFLIGPPEFTIYEANYGKNF